MADFLICPRCRRQNPADAIFCNRCGVRLLSAGVFYRNRHETHPIGMGQLVLGLGVLVLAGLVLGGGAIMFLAGGPRPTPSRVAVVPTGSGLPTFVQPTPTLSPSPSPTLTLTPTFLPTVSPSPTPTPSPIPPPTSPPTPTPERTPQPTPVDCAVASTGSNVKTTVIGYGNATSRGPLGKTWCIRHVVIHPVSGWGTTKLLRNKQVVAEWSCLPEGCTDGTFDFVPPYRAREGSTIKYQFACYDDPATIDVNECADAIDDGATITIDYEAIAGPP